MGIISEEFSKKGIEVLNAAVASYSPSIYFRKTKYLIEDIGLDFDEVIVFTDVSDVQDEAYYYDFDEYGNVITTARAPTDFSIFTDKDITLAEHIKTKLNNNSILIRFFSRSRSAS